MRPPALIDCWRTEPSGFLLFWFEAWVARVLTWPGLGAIMSWKLTGLVDCDLAADGFAKELSNSEEKTELGGSLHIF